MGHAADAGGQMSGINLLLSPPAHHGANGQGGRTEDAHLGGGCACGGDRRVKIAAVALRALVYVCFCVPGKSDSPETVDAVVRG